MKKPSWTAIGDWCVIILLAGVLVWQVGSCALTMIGGHLYAWQ